MVYTVGPISGCHLNPAVTFGMTLSSKFPAERAFGHALAQVVGASSVLFVIASGSGHFNPTVAGFATTGYGDRSPVHYGVASAFICETVTTMILVLTTDIKAWLGSPG